MTKREKKIEYKAFNFEMKDINTDAGTFEGYCAVFGNIDEGGDIVEKGAFLRSINARTASQYKGVFPILFSHDYKSPAIGSATFTEDNYGLLAKGRLFIDRMEKAKDIFLNMKDLVSNSMSFMYDVINSVDATIEGKYVRYLKELKIFEASILNTGFGMNEAAGITTLKEADLDARETQRRILILEETLAEIKSKSADHDFNKKVIEDLKALRLEISKLAPHTDTFDKDELAKAAKAINDLTNQIKSDLKIKK